MTVACMNVEATSSCAFVFTCRRWRERAGNIRVEFTQRPLNQIDNDACAKGAPAATRPPLPVSLSFYLVRLQAVARVAFCGVWVRSGLLFAVPLDDEAKARSGAGEECPWQCASASWGSHVPARPLDTPLSAYMVQKPAFRGTCRNMIGYNQYNQGYNKLFTQVSPVLLCFGRVSDT
ncbi:hypothetical protein AAG570_001282 [Ranatra chinensis]|uniref:Uncharacterized protein n=1 Tax=Ranatra chinensis TaxID=642074 RepID=A0ABD0YXU8_9HEMI